MKTRKTKFRAWDKKQNRMLHYDNDVTPCITFNGVCQGESHTNVSFDYILMQYTGLKDKNGKEIYEGDIINAEETTFESGVYNWEIFFDDGMFVAKTKKFDTRTALFDLVHFGEAKIIGNIYENPNLLK